MAVQTSYTQNPNIAVAGMRADTGVSEVCSGVSSTRKLMSVAVVAANGAVYTVTLNGTAFAYTADGSATTAEIVAGLVALINAGTVPVTASGTDTPLILESDEDADFTYSDSATGGSLTETVLVAANQELIAGKFVCLDERGTDASNDETADGDFPVRMPRQSSDVTGNLAFGMVLEDRARAVRGSETEPTFRSQTMVPVLRMGRAWVTVEQDVALGGDVYVRYAAGGDGLGSFGASAGSSERALLPRAKYLSTALDGELALVEINK